MKILILAILSLFSLNAMAIDQASLDTLKRQGFQVRMGELTGAGGKMSIVNLAGLIHPHGIVMKSDCKSISVSQVTDTKISDITKVVVDQSVIPAAEFEGFFTYK